MFKKFVLWIGLFTYWAAISGLLYSLIFKVNTSGLGWPTWLIVISVSLLAIAVGINLTLSIWRNK